MRIPQKFSESLKTKIKKQFTEQTQAFYLCYIGVITV